MGAQISEVSVYLPEKIITNDELVLIDGTLTSAKISGKLGINQRHVVSENETSLDLGYNACLKILKKTNKEDIDFLLLCTQSPDYILPTSACILQDKLGLKKTTGAFDFNLGCSGYIYGLAIAKGLIEAKIARNIILVTAETYSKMLNPKDISNRSIFGDGATATLVQYSDENKIFDLELGTDGSGFNNLIVKNGCFRNPIAHSTEETLDSEGNEQSDNNLYMNGPEIFNFTLDSVPALVKSVLEKNQLDIEEVDYFIFHQANKFMLNHLRNKIGIPREKFYVNLENTGNTVSSTIPIALKDAYDTGLVKTGDKILLCGFGVGYSWGAVIIKL
jgi:3-oxoacyl-[acyl-carrier-protein] synthase-3